MINNHSACENIFAQNGPFFHIFTTPPDNELLFVSHNDFKEAVNMLALSITECGGKELAYAIMNNHIHNIVAAERSQCMLFITRLRKRLDGFLKRAGKRIRPIDFHIVDISDLKQLRDEVAYVIRNPYVARTDVNPFSYPWCSGFMYFNNLLSLLPAGTPAGEIAILARRAIKHERNHEMDASLRIHDGMILPASFVDYGTVMALFESARQFIWWVTRNVEAHTATAGRLGEKAVVTDEEVSMVALRCCKKEYGAESLRLLTLRQKSSLVRTLKYEYGASNRQLSRCTGIPLAMIDEMFPGTAPSS